METQNIIEILNHMTRGTWLIVLLGLVYILILENETIRVFLASKKKKSTQLMPLWKRGKYMLLGLLVLFLSWTIVNLLSSQILPEEVIKQLPLKDSTSMAGLTATIGLHLSAWTLMLSAGGRWMVNLSKLLATLSVLYLVFTSFMAVI